MFGSLSLPRLNDRTIRRLARSAAASAALALGLVGTLAAPRAGIAQEAAPTRVAIGTGGETGVYYPAGGAICRMLNRGRDLHGIRCGVEATDGSLDNLAELRAGLLDFGIVQSDWQHHAANGTDRFAALGPFEDLRAVLALHAEPFTVVARADAGIATFADLAGKRVSVGTLGSGQRATLDVLLDRMGWSHADFARARPLPASDQARALCEAEIDALVYIVGHPAASIREATEACDSRLIAVPAEAADALIAEAPFYSKAEIPGGLYRGNPDPVPTFGVRATLVTRASVAEETVYALVRAVFEAGEVFRSLHPALTGLGPDEMARSALSAPLHPGALRYFREAGLGE
mgnify:FL=1